MPVAGRKPKDGPKRNRMPATHDWIEVEDKPFRGKRPVALPKKRTLITRDGPIEVPVLPATVKWWQVVSTMPHCRLWRDSDWTFALATALVADHAFRGQTSAATELRQREKILGTTVDSRRDLRIRYVEPAETPRSRSSRRPNTDNVVELDPRRARMMTDAP